VNVTSRNVCDTTFSTTTNTYGEQKISMHMVTGHTQMTMAGFGNRTRQQSTSTQIGRRIVTVTGSGVRLTAGPGLVMNRGVGLRTTTVDGFTTVDIGPGVREARTTVVTAGGVRHSSRLSPSTTTIVGTRLGIIIVIHIRETTNNVVG
jgi:hypothetical protein